MAANTFGQIFKVSTFGESHGPAIGCLIEGCPAGLEFNSELLQKNLDRRRPGQNQLVSSRQEPDQFEVLSGVFEGKTLGTPICMVVRNQDGRSQDYQELKNNPRRGHADDVWQAKFQHTDYRGGGRASGRETVARVLAGSVAQMLVQKLVPEIKLVGFLRQMGPLAIADFAAQSMQDLSLLVHMVEASVVRCPDQSKSAEMSQLLIQAKELGHSYGGTVELRVQGVPAGLGQPVFHKIKSDLAAALMSVGAVTAFEMGDGFYSSKAEGSQFHQTTERDVYGGVRGGISTGEPWRLQVAFKPTSSVLDVAKKGRHDPCVAIRAIPVLEAMVYLVLADHLMWKRLDQV